LFVSLCFSGRLVVFDAFGSFPVGAFSVDAFPVGALSKADETGLQDRR
jgi:hypothetical protein